jgi:hypothetical protein
MAQIIPKALHAPVPPLTSLPQDGDTPRTVRRCEPSNPPPTRPCHAPRDQLPSLPRPRTFQSARRQPPNGVDRSRDPQSASAPSTSSRRRARAAGRPSAPPTPPPRLARITRGVAHEAKRSPAISSRLIA